MSVTSKATESKPSAELQFPQHLIQGLLFVYLKRDTISAIRTTFHCFVHAEKKKYYECLMNVP